MNQMNVAGMNPGAGGPVGGVPMVNNGSAAPRNDGTMNNISEQMINNLNTYIYDYFLKRGYHDCARALLKDDAMKLSTEPPIKSSPGHRRDNEVNGVDGDAMMTDGKDGEKMKIPDDLPRPNLPSEGQQSPFLLDWFSLFWDFFWAQRKKGNSNDVRQYLQHNQNFMRMREQHHNQLLRQQPMMPGQLNIRRNGVPPNLQKTVLQNNTPGLSQQQIAQLQKNQQMQMMQQMQREHSDIDMNGHRPQSPSSADNAPSPSKRPRLEGTHMNGQQLAPNGRGQGQGMPAQPNPQAIMLQNGLNPRTMNPAQFQTSFPQSGPAGQQKSIQVYAQNLALHHSRSALNNQGMPNGLMNPGVMPPQTDLVPMPDGQGMYPMNGDYYGANGQMAQVRAGMQTPGGQHGNHALQDYQMQLMLLEQQNKRRLMMARQEQDSMARPDGQPPMPGQQQALPPGTSPQGSRAGTSPNPNDQMKRGTPKMPQTGLPGSPSAGDVMAQGRASPASMSFAGGQIPPEMAGQFFVKGMPEGMPGPNGMRPPSSNPAFTGPQMGQPIPAGANNRVPSGSWQPQQGPQGQPMAPQPSPASQPQTTGTPQNNPMPPPQAPPAAGGNAGRASPQTGAAPPTPQQANKPAPKGKKDTKDSRKRPSKKASNAAANANTAATPSSEAEHPPTPTPSTPITPQHPNSFNKAGANATTTAPQPPTSAPAPQPLVQQPPDQSQQSFNDLSIPDPSAFNLDFSALENPDILENFDFDTFLNTDADTASFGFDPNMPYPTDGVETGAGDSL
ncbi:putative cAMP-dependent protein kinase pathway protein (Som1) [Aspergillus melleus]|uniref:putative cAMP-dependent protein kinase pathway protein (Som1) n=1 Tax=Aspergillus melleus TaxID=138277 RepID=UPI001E8EAEE0|nr:uncharacterized protein LDX57_008834 [Aspergillus melleus]KAH8431175.1 hypothetical protein LDX57_008834 [Aspergillus melleus]